MAIDKLQDNYLVPKHEVVPKEKAQEVLEKFGSSAERFPQIGAADPIIEEIGGKKGDIVKIVRQSRTAGQAIYYRVVV